MLRASLDGCDIFLLESVVPNEYLSKYELALNQLSKRKLSPDQMTERFPIDNSVVNSIHDLIFASGKRIVIERSSASFSDLEAYNKAKTRACELLEADPAEAVRSAISALETFAEVNSRRDTEVAEQVKSLIEGEGNGKILVYRGIGHRRRFEAELTSRNIPFEAIVANSSIPLSRESMLLEKAANDEKLASHEVIEVLNEWNCLKSK